MALHDLGVAVRQVGGGFDDLRSTSRPFGILWRTPKTLVAYENRAVFRHPDVDAPPDLPAEQ